MVYLEPVLRTEDDLPVEFTDLCGGLYWGCSMPERGSFDWDEDLTSHRSVEFLAREVAKREADVNATSGSSAVLAVGSGSIGDIYR